MEFNIESDRLIGIVDHELGGRSARIKVLAFITPNNQVNNINELEAMNLFPPKGFVFEPGFFHNHNFQVKDIICFSAEENEMAIDGKDLFRIAESQKVQRYGVKARRVKNFSKHDRVTDLSKIIVIGDDSDGDFYGITDKYIIGKLRKKGSLVEPIKHHRINIWDLDELNVMDLKSQILLHKEPSGESFPIDCMDDKTLFDWFRKNLRKIDPDYVALLDKKAKWRDEFPILISNSADEIYEVDKTRLKRIVGVFDKISLSLDEILLLINTSDKLHDIFADIVENHKEEIKNTYRVEIDEFIENNELEKEKLTKDIETYSDGIELQKEILQEELNILKNKKVEKEKEIQVGIKTLEKQKKQIDLINQNKERILSDFSVISDVLSLNQNNDKKDSNLDHLFIMESSKFTKGTVPFSNRSDFSDNLKFHLKKHQLFPNYAKRMIDIISSSQAILLKDIRLGIAFAEATNNANYIIQQVEPDWLHFKDFWKNGLGEIWQSAHQYPDKLHLLFLQDLNLSSPECYARPLLDMISGIRKRIPFGNNSYPNNLKIMATRLPSHNPEIGLPVYEQTFLDWSTLGYSGDIYKKSNEINKSTEGFLTTEQLDSFKPDELDLELLNSSNLENNLVFDEA